MARRVKKPEDYGQLPLFEEKEPDWLKSADQLGYTLEPLGMSDHGDPFEPHADGMRGGADSSADTGDDDDELGQFVDWLQRKK